MWGNLPNSILRSNPAQVVCNRAATAAKLGRHADSLADANLAIEMDSEYAKAYVRRAQASLKQKVLSVRWVHALGVERHGRYLLRTATRGSVSFATKLHVGISLRLTLAHAAQHLAAAFNICSCCCRRTRS
jgi:hypothetical protein